MDADRFVVNVDGAVARDGEYLLVERDSGEDHAAGTLGLPGGTVERAPDGDESVEATVTRELAEEVGLSVTAVEYVLSRTFETDTGDACLHVVTHCETAGGEARPRASDEVAGVRWLSIDELRDRDDVPAHVEQDVEAVEQRRR